MSAVNPVPTPGQGTSEKRSYEPSMEEILASIRRIIADDQSMPKYPDVEPATASAGLAGDVLRPSVPPVATPPEPSPFSVPHAQAPQSEPVAQPRRPASDETSISPSAEVAPFPLNPPPAPVAPAETRSAYEPGAAPHFAAPHGPVGDDISTPPMSEPAHVAASDFVEERLAMPEPTLPDLNAAAHSEPADDDEAVYDTPIEPPGPSAEGSSASALFSATTDSSVSSAFNLLAATRLADNSDELMNLAREMIRPLLRTWLDDNLPSMVERMVRAEIERVARGGR